MLAGISGLDLVAKTVVDGFIAGLHRSPDFGFSQEFAEYRAYTPGDDLRHVDWNVFARTERMYLKRYRGETNCQLTILLDASRSMKFTSHKIEKLEYAQFLAASLAYLAHMQRDAAGLIVFDDEVRNFVRAVHAPGPACAAAARDRQARRSARAPISRSRSCTLQEFLRRRGVVVRDFGFLGAARKDHQDRRAAALSRQ